MPGCSRQSNEYVPGGAEICVKVTGSSPGFGLRIPLLATALPSKVQGSAFAPHVGSLGNPTAGLITSSSSSPPASTSGSMGAHAPPGP
jgi:hypothetical protein